MREEPATLPLPLPLPTLGLWDGALLEPVAEINERMVEGLQRRALAPSASDRRDWPPMLRLFIEEWRELEPLTRQRLASCPYLLLDIPMLEFGPGAGRVADASDARMAGGGHFLGDEGVGLLRRALMFGWHVARSNAVAARILLGLRPGSLERLAACRLQELEALAEEGGAWLAPRWHAQPAVWHQLLSAARVPLAAPLRSVQLRGLQLLASQLG